MNTFDPNVVEAWRSWPLPTEPMDLHEWQAGRCAMCGYEDRLVRDHCHDTGLVRGLLCCSCNSQEGDWSRRGWTKWRNGEHPAAALGVVEVYVNTRGQTPIRDGSVLDHYLRMDQIAWWDSIPAAVQAGEPWPVEAPWNEGALRVKALRDQQMRESMKVMNTALMGLFGRQVKS